MPEAVTATGPSTYASGAHLPGAHENGHAWSDAAGQAREKRAGALSGLIAGAIGVVYGDLGTSPLYTMHESFAGATALAPTAENVLGVLSLIFWSLMIVVTFKYVILVMRADNHGEGGILALMSLALRGGQAQGGRRRFLMTVGLIGAALFYGDGMVTPAISVLSAVEGLGVATSALDAYVVPITVVVLVALFMVQRHGTHKVGGLFGPVMGVWFAVLTLTGLNAIAHAPRVLWALSPIHALAFFQDNGWAGFVALGSVVLALTGAEALYADMGHFGPKAIRVAWATLVVPALVINYFGQGALILVDPATVKNPFFLLVPSWGLYPLVALAALATVIASQAVISGAYSMSHQAILLGFLPRLRVRHTSVSEIGQIYMPQVNWLLLAGVLALVVGFKSSSNLAAAYGIAVTGTMAATTLLVAFVMARVWRWPFALVAGLTAFLLAVDLAFLGANLLKLAGGGWFPLAAGALMVVVMATWKQGRAVLMDRLAQPAGTLATFIAELDDTAPRVTHTAVFLTGSRHGVPYALTHNLRHNGVLHKRVVVATVTTEDVPFVPKQHRVLVRPLGKEFYRVLVRYGFMEQPDIPQAFIDSYVPIDIERTSFFVSREQLIPSDATSDAGGFPHWRQMLFIALTRNSVNASDFFKIPPDRVVELGTQIRL